MSQNQVSRKIWWEVKRTYISPPHQGSGPLTPPQGGSWFSVPFHTHNHTKFRETDYQGLV